MDEDARADPLAGEVPVGRLTLPLLARQKLERLAAARGMTPLRYLRERTIAWVMDEPEPAR